MSDIATETPTTAIAEYSLRDAALQELSTVDAGIAALVEQYGGKTYDVMSTAGMDEAKKARMAIRECRYKVPKIEKEKLDLLRDIGKDIKTEAARITTALFAIENPIHDQIEAETQRKAEEKAEKERIAAEALAKLNDMILVISKLPLRCLNQNSAWIGEFAATIEAQQIGGEFTGEIRVRAEAAKADAVAEIRSIHASTVEAEEKAAALKIEQEAETLRLEAEKAERERLAAIEREAMEKEQAAFAEEKRKYDLEQAEIKKQRDEEAAKFAAEKAAFEAEQAKINAERDNADREAREKQAAIDAENKRQQDEIAAQKQEAERQAAIVAEQNRIAAEKEKKAAEKARKLAEAKFKSASVALQAIQDICADDRVSDYEARTKIALIAEANI